MNKMLPEDTYAIGVDVGATKIATALVRRDGRVVASRQAPTPVRAGPQAGLDAIADEVIAVIEADEQAAARIQGIGVGTPGQVLAEQGVVLNAVNMGWERVELAAELRSRLSGRSSSGRGATLPVWIAKDANASSLGEYYYGAARGCQDFAYLSVGSGLGGGLMADGRMVTGSASNAAEVGHLSLDPDGLLCACGQRGCAETLASGPGLVNAARRILEQERPRPRRRANTSGEMLAGSENLTPARILASAEAGDPAALAALEIAGNALGIVAAVCVALLNPQRIIIGGGLGVAAFKFLERSVRLELARRTLPASHQDLALLPSELASPAVGAACLVWYAG